MYKEMVRSIVDLVKEHHSAAQIFGPWCGEELEFNNTPKHTKLVFELEKYEIRTVKIGNYADVYLSFDISEADEKKIIGVYRVMLEEDYRRIAELWNKNRIERTMMLIRLWKDSQ